MKEPTFRAFRMERSAMYAAAERSPDHHRDGCAPAIVVFRCHLGDLIKGAGNEVRKLHLHDWPHPHHRRSDRSSHKAGLGQRCIQYPPLAVLLLEALCDPEGSAIRADVLAHEEDPLVAAHLLVQGF